MEDETLVKGILEGDIEISTAEVNRLIPRIAKNRKIIHLIADAIERHPTNHELINKDARDLSFLDDSSVQLAITSPPYWTLKDYNVVNGQLGYIDDYEEFLSELDRVWSECRRVLVPGGRLVIVVGDVCLSRRKHKRHRVMPLHADIQVHCRRIGFDNLAPIFWYKIANANHESNGSGGGFLGKPYEPNGVVKHDIEYILMERKPGGYRKPSYKERILSLIPSEMHRIWFQQVWNDIAGASTRKHPAPFPETLANRLIRMFSFVGDTILDPFNGTGTTMVAAANAGRNSIGVEIDPDYTKIAENRLRTELTSLYLGRKLIVSAG